VAKEVCAAVRSGRVGKESLKKGALENLHRLKLLKI
jgi:hypothetical protein